MRSLEDSCLRKKKKTKKFLAIDPPFYIISVCLVEISIFFKAFVEKRSHKFYYSLTPSELKHFKNQNQTKCFKLQEKPNYFKLNIRKKIFFFIFSVT